jgi:hypothetical protein
VAAVDGLSTDAVIFGFAARAESSTPFGLAVPKLGHFGAVIDRTPLRQPPPVRLATRRPIATAPSLPRPRGLVPGAEQGVPEF